MKALYCLRRRALSVAARGTQRSSSCARWYPAIVVVIAGAVPCSAFADLTDVPFQSEFEQAAARAVQATYDMLFDDPNDPNDPGSCTADQRVESSTCNGVVFATFESVRELVETGNELTGDPDFRRQFSLNLDQENLGFALRWNAAEELAAQGSSATQFSSSQLDSLASRLAALRFGARGAAGGGASADSEDAPSLWSMFANGSFGYGHKDDTTDPFPESGATTTGTEDAFDFDTQEVTIGADYRVSNAVVVGAMAGYTARTVDFDSTVSIVDGIIDVKGESFILFGTWEGDRFYLSGSIGAQWLEYEMFRRITYPSFNPLIPPTDITRFSETDSDAVTATFSAGFRHEAGAFGFELFLESEYLDIKIDGATEQAGTTPTGHELQFGDQDIKSFDLAPGVSFSYNFAAPFGVVIPYLRGEFHKELENERRNISAFYAGAGENAGSDADFNLSTDDPDDDYALLVAGFSIYRSRALQGYLQYQQIFELDNYDDRAIVGGIRVAF